MTAQLPAAMPAWRLGGGFWGLGIEDSSFFNFSLNQYEGENYGIVWFCMQLGR